ncbi:MAG: hypothetical protein ACPGWR_13075 [Ardenticatenaceae bacterium]
MRLQQQLVTELNLRAQLLAEEMARWQKLADENKDGMGIHQSQISVVQLLFEELDNKQQKVLGALNEAQGRVEFTRKRMDLENELSATHGIIAIFRNILAQRKDERYFREVLDAADLIAADCYKPSIQLAAQWGAISEEEFRVPPLTYLNTMYSPAAFTRRHFFGAFKMPLNGYVELKLPISVVSLPFHHTEALWTFCTIYHEVGHLLDQDLALHEGLRPSLEKEFQSPQGMPPWSHWLKEMIADTFGILLGSAGFAYTMMKLLLLPHKKVTKWDQSDRHPTPYVRIFLLGALLRAMEEPDLAEVADRMEQTWREWYGEPTELAPYVEQGVKQCPAVAEILLHQPLEKLGGHCLRDFVPTFADDQKRIASLATYLRLDFKRPDPRDFPVRLVPAAAQLAAWAVNDNKQAKYYPEIQERTLKYLQALRHHYPAFLHQDNFDNVSPNREAYLRGLVEKLNFSTLELE